MWPSLHFRGRYLRMTTLWIWYPTYAKASHCFHLKKMDSLRMPKELSSGTPHIFWGNFSPFCSSGAEFRATLACLFLGPEFQQAVFLFLLRFWSMRLFIMFFEASYGFHPSFTFYLPLFCFSMKVGPEQLWVQVSFSVFHWHAHVHAHWLFKTLKRSTVTHTKLIMVVISGETKREPQLGVVSKLLQSHAIF